MYAADLLDAQRHDVIEVTLDQPLEAVADPDDLCPLQAAQIVAAPITLLMPGAGPPPHKMPNRICTSYNICAAAIGACPPALLDSGGGVFSGQRDQLELRQRLADDRRPARGGLPHERQT